MGDSSVLSPVPHTHGSSIWMTVLQGRHGDTVGHLLASGVGGWLLTR